MNTNSTPEAPTKKSQWVKPALIVGASLALIGIGAGISGGETVEAPVPTVTVTAPATETTTVPQPCLDALNQAEDFAGAAADLSGLMSQHMSDESAAWTAAANGDTATLEAYSAKMSDMRGDIEALAGQVNANTFAADAAACRAAS